MEDFAEVQRLVQHTLDVCANFGMADFHQVTGTHHYARRRRQKLDLLGQLRALHPRHDVIEKGQINRILLQILQRRFRRLERFHTPARAREQFDKNLTFGRVVIDNHNPI